MVCFSDLDNRIITRILNVACYNISGSSARVRVQRQLVVLASVSWPWHEVVRAHMLATLVLECQPVSGSNINVRAVSSPKGRRRPMWKSASNSNGSSSNNSDIARGQTAGSCAWQTNAGLIRILQEQEKSSSPPASMGTQVTRLRIQCFDTTPNLAGFAEAMGGIGFAQCRLDTVTVFEVMDCIELRAVIEPEGNNSGGGALKSGEPKSPGSKSSNGVDPAEENAASAARAAVYIAQHVPNVQAMKCAPWDVSPQFQHLAAHLARVYIGQLRTLAIPLATPLAKASTSQAVLGTSLTTLHIHAQILACSGSNIIPARQLQVLRLHDADAFFSWAAFASDNTDSADELVFASLTTLSIGFEHDNVVTTSDFYSMLRSTKSSSTHVTMGRDRRRLLFPKLQALSVHKVPFTYPDAWRMFAVSPIKRLAVAGPYAHIRYIEPRLLRSLDVLDIHTVTNGAKDAKFGGRFTGFVKAMLGEDSAVKSAWLRHSETFPLSVPEVVKWTQLTELSISAYMPALALLLLVGQLPALYRLVVQRIASDGFEETLDVPPSMQPWGLITAPASPVSRSVRELQIHMGCGPTTRIPTLQAICYVLLCLPNVRLLAIKHAYWRYVREFIKQYAASNPGLANIELVRHVFMNAKSPLFSPE
ncbi:hypothetical protein IWW50_001172 [Coemansia erecta]|nr:hypothetical protein IWW50_001172 [Coemansia erecta]